MIVGVVPVKDLGRAKTRLAGVLPQRQRSRLAWALARHTVRALRETGAFGAIAVVTLDSDLACQLGAVHIADAGSLNGSLRSAVRWAQSLKAKSMLVVPADLPLITAEVIRTFIDARVTEPSITISRSLDGGTGALLLSPPSVIEPSFGPNSFLHHTREAVTRGIAVREVRCLSLSLDLDTPADLRRVTSRLAALEQEVGPWRATLEWTP